MVHLLRSLSFDLAFIIATPVLSLPIATVLNAAANYYRFNQDYYITLPTDVQALEITRAKFADNATSHNDTSPILQANTSQAGPSTKREFEYVKGRIMEIIQEDGTIHALYKWVIDNVSLPWCVGVVFVLGSMLLVSHQQLPEKELLEIGDV